jgi:hypothetical protein
VKWDMVYLHVDLWGILEAESDILGLSVGLVPGLIFVCYAVLSYLSFFVI